MSRKNHRTGRIRLEDPRPPPPATYLEVLLAAYEIKRIKRQHSQQTLFIFILSTNLRHLFRSVGEYSFFQEATTGKSSPNISILKGFGFRCPPNGELYEYGFLLVETLDPDVAWDSQEIMSKPYARTVRLRRRMFMPCSRWALRFSSTSMRTLYLRRWVG
ncbi:hypothetical protein GLAREA_03190 [Glarea lozoyensis ATCC 20868]|uniref:Uncharacterized protein n=1 Tax=Glarea lozoyensis (strain ATCC 20868 / MF5171) TaxID=1116229 RepID=S3CNK6_GLAL2|nr:uncharacterized protein GLAREA_03190 [Glarea lozoyensis ATCC 20868]EPE27275.1 hypothetical protein GLAREA_03190 [Glarea lozoyensis ATCC 20868]